MADQLLPLQLANDCRTSPAVVPAHPAYQPSDLVPTDQCPLHQVCFSTQVAHGTAVAVQTTAPTGVPGICACPDQLAGAAVGAVILHNQQPAHDGDVSISYWGGAPTSLEGD